RDKPADPKTRNPAAITDLEGRSLAQWIADMRSKDASVRERAVCALPYFGAAAGTSEVITHLLDVLASKDGKDRDTSPRIRALMALGTLDIPKGDINRVVNALAVQMDDPQAIVRYYAVLNLIRLGEDSTRAVGRLAAWAEDPVTWEVRHNCLVAL